MRLVKYFNICIHNLQETLNTRHTSLELLCELYDSSNGSNQCGHIHHICHKITGLYHLLYHKETAHYQHQQIHDTVKHLYRSVECCHISIGQFFNIQKDSIILLKLAVLNILIGKCLDHLMPQKTVLNTGIQFSDLITLFTECSAHAEIQGHTNAYHQWDTQENNDCQGQVDSRQDHKRNHSLDCCDKKFLRTVMRKLCYIEQIVSNAPHDLSDLGIIIVSIGQLLQMIVSITAHIRFNLGSHHMPHIRHIITCKTINNAQDQI